MIPTVVPIICFGPKAPLPIPIASAAKEIATKITPRTISKIPSVFLEISPSHILFYRIIAWRGCFLGWNLVRILESLIHFLIQLLYKQYQGDQRIKSAIYSNISSLFA